MNSPLINRLPIPHRDKYGRRPGKITRVILHNWAGTSGGDTHLAKPSVKASTTYIVYSDGGIALQVPEQYRPWTSGGAAADNPSITIETQNSTMGPDWKVTDQALDAIVRLLADIARRYGWGSITPDRLRGHKEFQSTTCPGPYLWARMDYLRAEANKLLQGGTPTPGGSVTPAPVSGWDGKPIRGGIITTPYGIRGRNWSTDRRNGQGIHTGDDWNTTDNRGRIATKIGEPVYAVADGTVTIADGGALGLMSILKGDNGRFYRYCHLLKGSRDPWNGERVKAGQKIAEVGDTGQTTGPHLHLEDTSSAQVWPPVGHRKPSWPLPLTATQPEEDPVPDHRETRTTLAHPGGGAWVLPEDKATVVLARRVPQRGTVVAHLSFPDGVEVRTRWVSWDDRGKRWVRYGITRHTGGTGETTFVVGQGGGDADLRLDVWADQACEVGVLQSAITWGVA